MILTFNWISIHGTTILYTKLCTNSFQVDFSLKFRNLRSPEPVNQVHPQKKMYKETPAKKKKNEQKARKILM